MDGCVTAACAAALRPQHCRPCTHARSTKWPTRIVAVVAAYDRPRQQFQNSSTVTFVIYQRLRPSEPNYSPNIGAEGGVHIQFILDHYNDLPLQTVFMNDDHNRRIVDWMEGLSESLGENHVVFFVTHGDIMNRVMNFLLARQLKPGITEDEAPESWVRMHPGSNTSVTSFHLVYNPSGEGGATAGHALQIDWFHRLDQHQPPLALSYLYLCPTSTFANFEPLLG